MSINNVRAVGDDRPWKDEVERELYKVWDAIRFGKVTIRSGTTGGGGGGGVGPDAISAELPATYNATSYVIGVDQGAFDYIENLDYAKFDTASTAAGGVGILKWNDTDGTLEFGLKGGNVTLQIGQEEVIRVRNNTGSTLSAGTVCYINGSNGINFNVAKALATGDATSAQTLGVLTEELNTSSTQHGFLTTFGLVRGIDLSYISGLAEGDQLYLDGTTAGRMTKVKPVAPVHLVYVGICLSANGGGTNSSIFVKVQNGYELGEIHDVDVTGVTDGQVLAYDAATDLWGPVSVTGTGTVTSVDTGTGLTGGPITTSGTISLDADLNDLTDTTITGTPADNELLAYDSGTSQWINQTSDEAGIVQVYEQDTAPTGKVGDFWIDTSVNYPVVPVGLTPIIPASVVVGSGTATVNANGRVTFSGVSSLSLNGVFSSAFDNYKIIFNATGGGTPLSSTLRMRAAGTNTSTSNYLRNGYISYGINTGSGNYNASTDVGFLIGFSTTAFGTDSVIDLIDPAKAAPTRAHWSLNGYDANHFTIHAGGTHPVSTAYDGFGITLSSSVINGGLQVYGYN